ncbi:MAG TPA: HAMP domain-containing sensor histidine kinase [Thiotrichaceae bacterium]|jgi:nitrogen fixation/metabolism regulation signal transduction histidine kinase|nr:HAMP domain-containing sensor histidine kinase [Thiotrichaceae bacterium]HIM07974.1 HAMP domain-containing sensor histidine kinase [Gammaproteobacteria bacterium]
MFLVILVINIHLFGSLEPFVGYTHAMSIRRPKSLKNLIFRHEIAILFLVAVTGLLGGVSAYFWQHNSAESVRINAMFYLTEQIRGELYAQIQDMIRARVLEDERALEAYPEHSRSISDRFNELRRRSNSREEDISIQELNLSYREIQGDMNKIFDDPYSGNRLVQIQILNPAFAQQMVGKFESRYFAFKQVLTEQHKKLDEVLAMWTTFAPFIIPIPLIFAFIIVFYTRHVMRTDFIKPLANIIKGAGEISHGKLDYHIEEEGVEEVSDLASGINSMAKELSESRDALLETERQATLGALVPVVAHNIRNPLASIRATAQLLEGAENQEEIIESSEAIIETTDRLERWVSSLVSYLHPLKPNLTNINAPDLIDAAFGLLHNKIADKKIEIIKEGWDISQSLSVDPDLMEQALYSLLANAVDASPKSSAIKVSLVKQEDNLEFRILDSGPGLPFEPKSGSLEPGPSTKKFGTGLGIPIAFKICQKHGWDLSFNVPEGQDKGKGQGTEAIVSAPIHKLIKGEV